MNDRTCTVENCTNPHRAKGLCASHLQSEKRRQFRTGERPLPEQLSPNEQTALDIVRGFDGEAYTRDIQAVFWATGQHIRPSNLTYALDRLIRRGLIKKADVPKGHPNRYSLVAK